jgi:hypothetical protein
MQPLCRRRIVRSEYSHIHATSALIVHEKRPQRGLPHDKRTTIVRAFLTTEYGQSM